MLDTLIALGGYAAAAGIAAFVVVLAVGLVSIFALAVRLGHSGSSQVRRANLIWFRRLHRVFWAMYSMVLLYALLHAFRGR